MSGRRTKEKLGRVLTEGEGKKKIKKKNREKKD